VKRLRERYPLAGLKIWEQSEFNPTATASWEALREIIVNTIARRAGQNENGTEIVPPSQNVSHPVI
jgi:hypothetical protein